MDEPTSYLTEPRAEPDVNQGYVNPTGFFDAVSLTHWINEAIEGLTGHNLINELVEPFTGDWEAFANCGVALANTADCLQQLGKNAQYSAYTLDARWDGNASDAAYHYFTDLALAVSHLQGPLDKAADEYARTARGVWLAADTVASLTKQAIDAALIAIIASAAGTITAATGAGAVLGYGVAALEVVRILQIINKAGKIITSAGVAIGGSFGTIMALANQSRELTGGTLPRSAYAHPALP